MGRPSAWNSPTVAVRVPVHAVDQLLVIARQLDTPRSFVQNSAPRMITIERGPERKQYLLGLDSVELTPQEDALVEQMVDKFMDSVDKRDRDYAFTCLVEKILKPIEC